MWTGAGDVIEAGQGEVVVHGFLFILDPVGVVGGELVE